MNYNRSYDKWRKHGNNGAKVEAYICIVKQSLTLKQ